MSYHDKIRGPSGPVRAPVRAPSKWEYGSEAMDRATEAIFRVGPHKRTDQYARAALEAAATLVEGMCHWKQGRHWPGEDHWQFHYSNPCPYEAMAAVLRGEPDPRD